MKKLFFSLLMLTVLACALLLSACDQGPCAAGHTAVTDAAVAATCTDTGLTEGSHCSVCSAVITAQEVVPATGHTAGDWITQIAPTCTQKGSRYNSCTVCKALLTVESVDATGHIFGEWTELAAATCTKQGKQSHTCTVCQTVEQAPIAVLPHRNGSAIVSMEPTCDAPGSQYFKCEICHNISLVEILPATGHSYGIYTQISAPTCVNAGAERAECSICHTLDTRPLPALGHTPGEWVTDFAATCLSGGSRHTACTVCEAILSVELTSRLDHSWTWSTTRAATCTQQGEQKAVCANCDSVQYDPLPLIAHTPGRWIEDVAPTCLSDGAKHQLCSVCEGTMDAQIVPKLTAHTPAAEWSVLTAPTATAAGENAQLCTMCGTPTKTVKTVLDGSVILQGDPVSKTMTSYRIIYGAADSTDEFLQSGVSELSAALKTATGVTISAYGDEKSKVSKEILIGETNRAESIAALAEIDGDGFAIRTAGSKLVIVGSDKLFTMLGVQYFIDTYLQGTPSNRTLKLHEYADSYGLSALSLTEGATSPFRFVMGADLDNDPQHMYVGDSWSQTNQGYVNDSRDLPTKLMDRLIDGVSAYSGLPSASFLRALDTATPTANEIQFGELNRAESLAFRAELDANEYGVRVTNGKVIIAAHLDLGLERALDAFLTLYAYACTHTNGCLPEGYEFVGSIDDQGWIMDFPRPTGTDITLKTAQNNNDQSLQMLYTGAGVTKDAYLAYCAQLEGKGYIVVTKNDDPGETGSYFRTYKKSASSHVLYVTYNAFAFEGVYNTAERRGDHVQSSKPNSTTVYYPMRDYETCIRIVSAPSASAYLPANSLLSKQNYTKICESSVTTVRLIEGVGMSYIIQLEDGRFVIVDGGATSSKYDNPKILYDTLTQLYKEAHDNAAPSTTKPIHIAAWYITHSHNDHYAVMNSFLSTYGKNGLLKMDYLIGNFPEISSIYAVGSDTVVMGNGTQIPTMQKYITGGFTYVKVHTGQVLYLANLKMEVLMTYEDHLPHRITNSNDTNTVTKLTISSASKDTIWMMLGDSCIYQSRWLCAMWGGTGYDTATGLYTGSYMKADMVQLAHHGNIGSEIAIYKTIQPTVVWFPHHSTQFNTYVSSNSSWPYNVDYFVCRTLSTVKYIVVSGMKDTSSSYTDSITLQFTASGPDYSNFFGIKSGQNGTFSIGFSSSTTSCSGSPIIKKN